VKFINNHTDGSSACVFKKFEEDIIMLNSKKIASLGLAMAMAATMAVPAFADTVNTSTKVTAVYKDVTIAVAVPTTNDTFINPYGLPSEFTYTNAQDGAKSVKISGQIVSTPMAIFNQSDYDLSVGAKVVTTTTGNAKIVSRLTSKGTDNEITAQLQIVQTDANVVGEATSDADKISDAVIKASADSTTWDAATSLALVSGTEGVSKDGLVTLNAAELGEDKNGAKTTTYKEGSGALVRLTGSCIEAPTTAWTATDGFTAAIAYTFKPATTE
jgi:hypothetical protein